MKAFQDKSVIVTGASSGIGRELAVAFARQGANVTVNFASSEGKARKTLEMVEAAGGRGILQHGDVSVEAEAEGIVKAAVSAFGGVDTLVNNAGRTSFIPFKDIEAITETVWRDILGVNVMGTFFVSKAAARCMAERGGSIVNIASVAGQRPNGSSIPYCASKAAVIMMTQCLAKALGPKVRVNSVSPGYISATDWSGGRTPDAIAAACKNAVEFSAAERVGIPDDLVGAVLYLASDGASFCSGIDILVDGGRALFL